MPGFITTCFCDWNSETFRRGVMKIRNGKRTDCAIRRQLRPDEVQGRDYYIKVDPDFDNGTYSRCHLKLRQTLQPEDVLFFRALWRERPYVVGYFTIDHKEESECGPVCAADLSESKLVNFSLEVTPILLETLNPKFRHNKNRNWNFQANEFLGRNYMRLTVDATQKLLEIIVRMPGI